MEESSDKIEKGYRILLQECEARYKAFCNQKFYAVYVHDFNGSFIDANDTALDLLGYSREEIPSINFSTLLDDETQIAQAFKTLEELKIYGFQKTHTNYKLKTKDGKYVWVETDAHLLCKEGKPYAIQGIARDITERKILELKIRESEEKFRGLVENINEIIYRVDRDGILSYISPAVERFIGYKTSEVIGRPFSEFIHEDDLPRLTRSYQSILSGQVASSEYRTHTKSGETRWMRTSSRPIYEGDTVIGVQGVLIDITDMVVARKQLRESELKYRHLFEESPFATALIGMDGVIIDCNPAIERIFGYSKEELIGKNFLDLDVIPLKYLEPTKTHFDNVLQQNWVPFELQVRKKDGNLVWVYAEGTFMQLDDLSMVQIIIQDINDRKIAEQNLKDSEKKFRQLFQSANDAIYVQRVAEDGYPGNIIEINDVGLQRVGYTREEISKMTVRDLADQAMFNEIAPQLMQEFLERGHIVFEMIAVSKTGTKIPVEINAHLIEFQGEKAILSISRDISKRKKVEKALLESEEKYREMVELLPDIVYETDLELNLTYVNAIGFIKFGYSQEDFIKGLKVTDMISPKDLEYAKSNISALLKGNILPPNEYLMRKKDGSDFYGRVHSRVIYKNGKAIGIRGLVSDINEYKEAEQQLRESEEKYRLITENANDLIIVHNQERELEYINEETHQKLLGYGYNTLKGKDIQDFFHPEDLEEVKLQMVRAFQTGFSSGEYRVKKADGTYIWTESITRVYRDHVGDLKVLTVMRDISERRAAEQQLRESEERYRLITENANDMIAVLNSKYDVEYINERAHLSSVGYLYSPGGRGSLPLEVIHPDDINLMMESLKSTIETGEGEIIFRLKRKDGSYAWIESKARTYRDSSGKLKLLTVSRDISERKELEESRKNYMKNLEKEVENKTMELKRETVELQKILANLEATQEQLIQSEKLASIGLLAAGIAHEINNPLMGIINYAQIVKDELENETEININNKPYSFLKSLIKEGERIAEIVRGLLTFAREDKGQFIYAEMSEIVNSALALLIPKLKNSQIEVQLDYNEALPTIPVQTRNMRQVILNILQNSVDAINVKFDDPSQKGLKKISITTSVERIDEKDYAKITIEDNGIGIKQKDLIYVFDPFFSTKLASKEHGMGLGLSISYGIIKDHSGDIQIQSVWQEYTKVNILLPLERENPVNSK